MRIKTFFISAAFFIPSFAIHANLFDQDKKSLAQIGNKQPLYQHGLFAQSDSQCQMSNVAPIVYQTPSPAEMPKGAKMPGAKTLKGVKEEVASSLKPKNGKASDASISVAGKLKAAAFEQKKPAGKTKVAKKLEATARQSTDFIKKTKGKVSSERLKFTTKKADGLSKQAAEKIKVVKKNPVISKGAKMQAVIQKGVKMPAVAIPNKPNIPAAGMPKVSSAARKLPTKPSIPKVPKI